MANTQTIPQHGTPKAATNAELFAELRALSPKQRRARATSIVAELQQRAISLNKIAEETDIARGTIQLWAPNDTTAKEES